MNKLLALALGIILISCGKEKTDQRITNIDNFLNGQVAHFKFNGNVLIADHGKIVYKKSFGVSNFDTKAPLNDSSVFELASVSKQFTAAGILILKEKGKLQLTDSLRKFFPELPYHNITVRHLLNHTSGVPDYESVMNEKWDRHKIAFNNDMIQFFAKEKTPVEFKPGQSWAYSNTGYALLASIIEKASGQSYKEFLAQNIFSPLKMTHSRIYNTRRSGELVQNYAYGFVWSDSLKTFMLPDSVKRYKMVFWLDGIQGDGVVNSTTEDLLKWDRGLMSYQILSKETTDAMLSRQAVIDSASDQNYGYGVMVSKNDLGNFITHSGGWPGYTTNLERYVDQDLTIIILSNNESASPSISGTLARIYNNQEVEMPYEHKLASTDTVGLGKMIGSYTLKNQKFKIAHEGGEWAIVLPSGARRKYIPESGSKLFAPERDIQFVMEKDNEGKNRYYRISYGVKQEITRTGS
jgi:CubicO group peptidase (beta-lactamase class C family)